MNNKQRNAVSPAILAGLFIFVMVTSIVFTLNFSRAASGNAAPSSPSQLHATITDLESAGFQNVQKAQPSGQRFLGPTDYFTVGDSVDPKNSEAANIVMVDSAYYPYINKFPDSVLYSYGKDSHPFTINGGTGQEATMADGRVAVSFVKGNNYTVIIGPNKSKIEALALAIANEVK